MKENRIVLNDESRVFVSSDWHMYKYDKETGLINKRPDFEEIIKNQNENVSDEDTFIFLGDLVDDQFVNKCMVRDIIRRLKGRRKIFVRGNNDDFEDDFYLSSGFTSVVYAVIWDKIVFSHTSIPVDDTDYVNIHGHIHREGWDCNDIPYYHPCKRNINVCFSNRKTVSFNKSDNLIDLNEMISWNNTWILGTEKPGMSMFIQNMAISEFRKYINSTGIMY